MAAYLTQPPAGLSEEAQAEFDQHVAELVSASKVVDASEDGVAAAEPTELEAAHLVLMQSTQAVLASEDMQAQIAELNALQAQADQMAALTGSVESFTGLLAEASPEVTDAVMAIANGEGTLDRAQAEALGGCVGDYA